MNSLNVFLDNGVNVKAVDGAGKILLLIKLLNKQICEIQIVFGEYHHQALDKLVEFMQLQLTLQQESDQPNYEKLLFIR